MDSNLLSWMAWTYKGYYPVPHLKEEDLPFVGTCTGCGSGLYPDLPNSTAINWLTAKSMARTYAQSVQGRAKYMHFNWTTDNFSFVYQFDPLVLQPTEIYINRELGGALAGRYAAGVDVIVVPVDFKWSFKDHDPSILQIYGGRSVAACEVSVF